MRNFLIGLGFVFWGLNGIKVPTSKKIQKVYKNYGINIKTMGDYWCIDPEHWAYIPGRDISLQQLDQLIRTMITCWEKCNHEVSDDAKKKIIEDLSR